MGQPNPAHYTIVNLTQPIYTIGSTQTSPFTPLGQPIPLGAILTPLPFTGIPITLLILIVRYWIAIISSIRTYPPQKICKCKENCQIKKHELKNLNYPVKLMPKEFYYLQMWYIFWKSNKYFYTATLHPSDRSSILNGHYFISPQIRYTKSPIHSFLPHTAKWHDPTLIPWDKKFLARNKCSKQNIGYLTRYKFHMQLCLMLMINIRNNILVEISVL